jgi:hypothetical protein
MPNVVEDDEWTVRPTDEDRVIKSESLYGRINIISPQLRVSVTLARFIRKAVTPYIHRDKPKVIGQVRTQLPSPREPTL